VIAHRVVDCAKKRGFGPEDFLLILVENGSTDNSIEVIESIVAGPHGAFVTQVRIPKNQGYGYGVHQGLKLAASLAHFVAWTHADQQCDPEEALRGWEILQASNQPSQTLIKGSRLGRRLGAWVVSRGFDLVATAITGSWLTEINAQPKVFHRSLVAKLDQPPNDFAFDFYVLAQARKAGFRISAIPVHSGPRAHGVSNWSHSVPSRVRTISKMVSYLLQYRFRRQ
jgi:glycosyltransferase involved in cell wall biosynthesis